MDDAVSSKKMTKITAQHSKLDGHLQKINLPYKIFLELKNSLFCHTHEMGN